MWHQWINIIVCSSTCGNKTFEERLWMLISLCFFLPLGTSPLTVVPTTGHGRELEEPWGREGEQDAQFELVFQVDIMEMWFFMLVNFFPLLLGKNPLLVDLVDFNWYQTTLSKWISRYGVYHFQLFSLTHLSLV